MTNRELKEVFKMYNDICIRFGAESNRAELFFKLSYSEKELFSYEEMAEIYAVLMNEKFSDIAFEQFLLVVNRIF